MRMRKSSNEKEKPQEENKDNEALSTRTKIRVNQEDISRRTHKYLFYSTPWFPSIY